MITRRYFHDISDEEIRQAFEAKDKYPESFLRKKAANLMLKKIVLIILVIVSAFLILSLVIALFVPGFLGIRETGDGIDVGFLLLILLAAIFFLRRGMTKKLSAEEVVKAFYTGLDQLLYSEGRLEEMGDRVLSDSYGRLAPSLMLKVPEDEFIDLWEDEAEEVRTLVKTLDSATCDHCKKSSGGLWDTHFQWTLTDSMITNDRLWVRCPDCKSVYCSECFVSFPERHRCPKCGNKLQGFLGVLSANVSMETFFTNPEVKMLGGISNVRVTKRSERAADVFCQLVFESKYEKYIKTGKLIETTEFDLGERGKVVLEFSNSAVKIGDDWCLVSARPGKMREQ